MKAAIWVLLLVNIALGLWVYGHSSGSLVAPVPIHPHRMRLASNGVPRPPAAAAPSARIAGPKPPVPPQGSALGGLARKGPKTPLPRSPAPKARPTSIMTEASQGFMQPVVDTMRVTNATAARCWRVGPFVSRSQATALLVRDHLAGRLATELGPPVYRVFLPSSTPWPKSGALRRIGIRGAYVTHGPAGGEVLSLGVFVERKAALHEAAAIRRASFLGRARHAVHIAAFGAPTQYYEDVSLVGDHAALWRRLGPIKHRLCR